MNLKFKITKFSYFKTFYYFLLSNFSVKIAFALHSKFVMLCQSAWKNCSCAPCKGFRNAVISHFPYPFLKKYSHIVHFHGKIEILFIFLGFGGLKLLEQSEFSKTEFTKRKYVIFWSGTKKLEKRNKIFEKYLCSNNSKRFDIEYNKS